MPETSGHASSGGAVEQGAAPGFQPGDFGKRIREATGVYDYDNTMRPLSESRRRLSEGTTFKGPSIKPITPPGGRTFI